MINKIQNIVVGVNISVLIFTSFFSMITFDAGKLVFIFYIFLFIALSQIAFIFAFTVFSDFNLKCIIFYIFSFLILIFTPSEYLMLKTMEGFNMMNSTDKNPSITYIRFMILVPYFQSFVIFSPSATVALAAFANNNFNLNIKNSAHIAFGVISILALLLSLTIILFD